MSFSDKAGIAIELTSAPFAGEPEGAKAYYEAIGRLTFLWGRFEAHFSSVLIPLLILLQGRGESGELPITWKKREDVWRKAFNKIPELASVKDDAEDFIARTAEATRDRHMIIHGAWSGFIAGSSPLAARLTVLRPSRKKSIELLSFNTSLTGLLRAQEIVDDLNTSLMAIGLYVTELYDQLNRRPSPNISSPDSTMG